MYVNPFWFGFLMAIVLFVVVIIVSAMVHSHREDEEDLETDAEYQRLLAMMDGKSFFMITRDGYLVGSEVPDKEDKEDGT